MTATCTYIDHGTSCAFPATHYTRCAHDHLGHWTVEDTPQQLETINGFHVWDTVVDAHGKQVLENGVPQRVPRMQTPEFCATHAEAVAETRRAAWRGVHA